ncbi:SHOCT domain-containing protein [Variovorax saccharolyticus]|uniref:SHOCT domain-containing protein n=1 Tax=Variovorax saccharolyticus TaxID=3053516 RepID=UPI0025778CB8|nr:SHOCT domain-containing protein [Variovorax sp. J31P216]MDM0028301.1 SHOCT domain-containing protein [Variovorax sp. J31P216]
MQMQSQFSRSALRAIDAGTAMPEALERALERVADRQGFGLGAAQELWRGMALGQGAMAQFDHAEFGGHGQWLRGGMLMIGDMVNAPLKVRVAALCEDLSRLYAEHPEWHAAALARRDVAAGAWWPEGLDSPSSTGARNGVGYAFFPAQRRLAIHRDGRVELFDTGDHLIGAVAQQEGDIASLRFASQHGPVSAESLRRVETVDPPAPTLPPPPRSDLLGTLDTLALERLAALRGRGVLTEAEFIAKKTELLGRL